MSSENWPAQFNLNELPTQTLKASTEEMIRHSLLNGDMKPVRSTPPTPWRNN